MRLLGCAAIFLICMTAAAAVLLEKQIRKTQLTAVLALIAYLDREISCTCAALDDLLRRCPIEPLPILEELDLSPPLDLPARYREAKKKSLRKMFFSRSDWDRFDRLFLSLGEGDREIQQRHLAVCGKEFENALLETESNLRKNSRPILFGGCAAGVLLAMLIL